MQIQSNIDSPLTSFNAINRIDSQQESNKQTSENDFSGSSQTDNFDISSLGSINQKIDSLFNQADFIYQSHITSTQQKALNESYSKLDELFSKNSPSALEQKSAAALFDKIDQIFEQAENQLTSTEKEELSTIDSKLDELLGTEDIELEGGFSEEIDALFQQSDNLLTSKLSTYQKKQLADLNQQLNLLFESNDIQSDVIDSLFDKIDSILNKGYDKLSDEDKNKFDEINVEIDDLFLQQEKHEVEISYP